MSDHSPGPWVKQGGFLKASDGTDVVVAGLGLGLGADSGDGVREANSRLIKEAPELLKLLIEAQRTGLDLHIGTAYISRAYITKQTALNERINELLARVKGIKQ